MPNKTYNYYSMLCISRGYQHYQNNLTTHLKSRKQHNLNDTHCDAIRLFIDDKRTGWKMVETKYKQNILVNLGQVRSDPEIG